MTFWENRGKVLKSTFYIFRQHECIRQCMSIRQSKKEISKLNWTPRYLRYFQISIFQKIQPIYVLIIFLTIDFSPTLFFKKNFINFHNDNYNVIMLTKTIVNWHRLDVLYNIVFKWPLKLVLPLILELVKFSFIRF